jgi:hypothetical protein
MAQLRQGEHLDEARVFIVEALAEAREVVFGELPVLPLRRLPVVGRHLAASALQGPLPMPGWFGREEASIAQCASQGWGWRRRRRRVRESDPGILSPTGEVYQG